MVRGIYSLIEQRSECDVELLEWMMFDSDISKALCTIYPLRQEWYGTFDGHLFS